MLGADAAEESLGGLVWVLGDELAAEGAQAPRGGAALCALHRDLLQITYMGEERPRQRGNLR